MTKKNKSKKKILIGIGSVAVVGALLYIGYSAGLFSKKEDNPKPVDEPTKPVKKLQIVDTSSNARPYAVVINNHGAARAHHAGLQDAYMVYEFIVEGGMTRYLAVFKDQDTSKIGSVRSARHYFLDYVLENDAIFVHWGWSPQAQSDISSLKINNINGLSTNYFYRDKTLGVATEHTGFTKMELLDKGTTKLKYRATSDQDLLLNYSVDPVDLSSIEKAERADTVTIKYSNSVTDKYEYDETNGVYKRFVNNKVHQDDITKKQYTFKNIITYQVDNDTITNDDKGRQNFYNTGSGTGYYISNGYAVPITWTKKDRSSQTVYKYENGKEIDVNDGNTFIQIQPKGETINILSNVKTTE